MTQPAAVTKAAIKRAIRAAQEEGAAMVDVLPDGTVRVILRGEYEVAGPGAGGQDAPAPEHIDWGKVRA